MKAFLGLFSFVLLALVHSGTALRCWACSSDLDASCNDHFNTTRLLSQRSYYQQGNYNGQYQNQNQRDPSPNLVDCNNNLGQIYGQKQVCVKRVLSVPYGRRVISRECKAVPLSQQSGTCSERNNNLEFCEYCEYDGCNSASGLKTNVILAMAVPGVLLLFLRR